MIDIAVVSGGKEKVRICHIVETALSYGKSDVNTTAGWYFEDKEIYIYKYIYIYREREIDI